uniref:Carbohydrate sulfotransferase n=1 Tax=Arion vulgaris TaxID=1028688 RepID=A0A0B7APE5_9EUPU
MPKLEKQENMRIPVRLLASVVFIGAIVPALLVYSGKWHTKRFRESSTTSTNGESYTTTDEHSITAYHKLHTGVNQESWRNHIERSCKKFGFTKEEKNFDPNILKRSRIIVDDKNKLLYCQIPKVASTTWRRILIMLSGKIDTADLMSMSANDVHHKYDQHLKYLTDLKHDEIIYRLKHYFKFVFVREPFERLLSAYRNKFLATTNSSNYFKRVFGQKIIAQYRTDIPETETGSDLRFEEFVTYLLDPDKKVAMNEHWERFYKLCHPCWITYDFIGKLETLEDDSKYILEKNSLSEKVKLPSRSDSKYSTIKTNAYMYEYYSRISRDSLKKLYDMYYADFVIFNFTVPDTIKSLMYQ